MKTIYVKITTSALPEEFRVWYATAIDSKDSPKATIKYLNKVAEYRKISATYELATEQEFWTYRKSRSNYYPVKLAVN